MSHASRIQASTLFVLGFFFELALVGIAAILGIAFHQGEPFPFRIHYDIDALFWTIGATLPVCAIAWLLTSRLGQAVPFLRNIYARVRDTLGAAIRSFSFEQIVLLAAAAGMGEEVLFRGVLQPLLGNLWTSLLFGVFHAVTLGYFALATGMSLYLGYLQHETNNLIVPMGVHWLYDVVALLLLRRRLTADPLCATTGQAPSAADGGAHSEGPDED